MHDRNPDKKQPAPSGVADGTTMQLLISMADTTWRMFTPPAIVVPGGIFADIKLHTKPWITLLAAVVGLGLSVLLVRQQLRGSK